MYNGDHRATELLIIFKTVGWLGFITMATWALSSGWSLHAFSGWFVSLFHALVAPRSCYSTTPCLHRPDARFPAVDLFEDFPGHKLVFYFLLSPDICLVNSASSSYLWFGLVVVFGFEGAPWKTCMYEVHGVLLQLPSLFFIQRHWLSNSPVEGNYLFVCR